VIDLDNFATGPRKWDLIQTAIFYDRLGWHTREEYEAFTKVYGYDIMQWPGYPMLADIRAPLTSCRHPGIPWRDITGLRVMLVGVIAATEVPRLARDLRSAG
jgi:hypothetical protein